MKDIYNNVAFAKCIAPQFINSNTTVTGTGVDLRGFEGCLFEIGSGAIAGTGSQNVYTPEIQESDSETTGFTAVADADLIGTETAAVHNGGTDNTVKKIGYIGKKRYVRCVLTTTNFTTAGGYIYASVLKGFPHLASTGA